MSTAETLIRIVAKDEASKVFKTVADASKVAMGIVAAGAAAAAGALAFATREAIAAEKAQRQLAISLASFGKLTNEAYDANVAFADSLALATGKSDDFIASLLATSLTLFKDEKAAQKATKTALDWASATGVDAAQAVTALARAQNGQARALQMLVPEVRNLTDAQLAAGAALDLLADKYAGAAENELHTFAGALGAAQESLMDVFEAIGKTITQDSTFTNFLLGVRDAFKKLQVVIEENKDSIVAFAKTFAVMVVKAMAFGIKSVGNATTAFWALAKGIVDIRIQLKEFDRTLADIPVLTHLVPDKATTDKDIEGLRALSKELERVGVGSAGVTEDLVGVADAFLKAGLALDEIPAAGKSVEETYKNVGLGIGIATDEWLAQQEAIAKTNKELDEHAAAFDAVMEGRTDIQNQLGTVNTDGGKLPDKKDTKAVGTSMAQAFMEGIQGAMGGTLSSALSGLGVVAVAGIGKALEGATDAGTKEMGVILSGIIPLALEGLAMLENFTAEQFNATIEGIMNGLVLALSNIGPMLVVLVENMDEIFIGLAKGLVQGVASILVNLPAIVVEVVGAMASIVTTIMPQVLGGLKNIVLEGGRAAAAAFGRLGDMFKTGIADIWDDAFGGLKDVFRKFRDWIKDLFSNMFDFSGIGDLFSFDVGGVIPTPMGTPTPAVVHGGEMVLNPAQQRRMFDLLDNGGGGGSGTPINMTIQERPMSRGEFRQVVLESIRDLIAQRDIVDIRA